MRYQSFYPFANQQRQGPPSQQAQYEAYPQAQPYMQSPAPPFTQSAMNPSGSPFDGMSLGSPGSASNPAGGQSQAAGQSKPEMYMETANRLISTAQQYAPIVQQFAPMLQNIPAMWRLYKGFQSLPDTNTQAPGPAPGASVRSAAPPAPRPSVPKVFQPPI